MTPEPTSVTETFGNQGQKAEYAAVYRIEGETIRIRIIVDPIYSAQSWAGAEVLNSDRKWTDLISQPVSKWHDEVRRTSLDGSTYKSITAVETPSRELLFLAKNLLVQARAILGL